MTRTEDAIRAREKQPIPEEKPVKARKPKPEPEPEPEPELVELDES